MTSTATPSPRPRVRLTREGLAWLALAVALWVIGVFKGVPLVVLFSSAMLVMTGLNWLAARRTGRALVLRRRVEEPTFARTPMAIRFDVGNARRRPLAGIRLDDRGRDHLVSTWPPRIPPGQAVMVRRTLELPRRGPYQWDVPRVSSSAPFGWAEASSTGGCPPAETLVYPRLGRVHRGRLRRFLTLASSALDHTRLQSPLLHPAAQGELHGVRTFRTGDSPRWIHWRTSARRGELMVREYEQTPTDDLIVVVDAWTRPPGNAAGADAEPDPGLEETLTWAASICWEWCRRKGDRLVLGLADREAKAVQGVTGRKLLADSLDALARAEGTPGPDPAALIACLRGVRLPEAPVLVLSARPDSFPDALGAALNRTVAFVNVSDPGSYDFFEHTTARTG